MSTLGNEIAVLFSQYNEQWLQDCSRLEQKLQLLHTLKQGMELLLLVSSFIFYFLTDCVAQVMDMPIMVQVMDLHIIH